MLSSAWEFSTSMRLASTISDSFFFKPLKLHLEVAYLFEQFRLFRLLTALIPGRGAVEDRGTPLHQLALLMADLGWMKTVLPGQLIGGLGPFRSLQGHFELELNTVPLPCR